MIGGYLPGPQIVLKVSNFQPYEMVLVDYRRLQGTAGQAISAVFSTDKVGFFCKAVIAVMSFAIPTEILKSKCLIKLYMEDSIHVQNPTHPLLKRKLICNSINN